jgi:site-specific recombinase XerD
VSEPVFRTPTGSAWCGPSNNLCRISLSVLERAGIRCVDVEGRAVDIHGLRHAAATRWARRGVSLHLAQRMLGHQDIRTTSSIYVHTGVEDLRVAVDDPKVRATAAAV